MNKQLIISFLLLSTRHEESVTLEVALLYNSTPSRVILFKYHWLLH